MQTTTNLGLKKPEQDDLYNIQDINDNMDILDEKVQECFQSVSDGKALMASGITDKGVPTDADATFQEMYDNVMAIQTNPTLQSKTAALSTSEQVIIADTGYDGLLQVTVPAVTGNASDGDVVAGKEFSSALGINQVGTLVDKTGVTEYTATASLDSTNSELEMTIPATGKYNTSNKLKATFATIASLIGLTAAKLVKGNTILGITGNSNNMDTSGGDATAAQILSGKKACVDGSLLTGTMANKGSTTVTASAVTQDDDYTYLTIPSAGYYNTSSKVKTANSNLGNKFPLQEIIQVTATATGDNTIDINAKAGNILIFATYQWSANRQITFPKGEATILYQSGTVKHPSTYMYANVIVAKLNVDVTSLVYNSTASGGEVYLFLVNKEFSNCEAVTSISEKDTFYFYYSWAGTAAYSGGNRLIGACYRLSSYDSNISTYYIRDYEIGKTLTDDLYDRAGSFLLKLS